MSSRISEPKNPNPQGKGQVVLLRDLSAHEEWWEPVAKTAEEISDDLFTSLFVLHSDCKFKAVPGQTYHMYRMDGRYKMLMVEPEAWSAGLPGEYWGACSLHKDMTWTLELSPLAQGDVLFTKEVEKAKQAFEKELESKDKMSDALPHHLKELSYYQRVMAYGLAKSLQASLDLGQMAELSFSEAKAVGQLPSS